MRKIIYASLFSCTLLTTTVFAQETEDVVTTQETTKKRFTSADKKFNDWSITLLGGTPVVQGSDLQTIHNGTYLPGYDIQLFINKQITHAFGLSVGGSYGLTRQKQRAHDQAWNAGAGSGGPFWGKTQYYGVTLLGDLNLSNLLRRIDNDSQFNWALHAYAGVGLLGYKAERKDVISDYRLMTDQNLDALSFYAQAGGGIIRKISRRIDLELRAMYVYTGDEEFDASGEPLHGFYTASDWEEGRDDAYWTVSLGLKVKLGKHPESLQWVDPLQEIKCGDFCEGEKGAVLDDSWECSDEDNDGVCDLWDRCPNTPEGIAVDGAGCPLDADRDGVPDSIDQCPTIPGPPTNSGCPLAVVEVSSGTIASILTELLEGIEFDFDSDVIRRVSYPKLDNAVSILQDHPNYKFIVEGHTDAAGTYEYNQNLSERRAASVVRYLTHNGVNPNQLIPVGKGKTELLHPECNPVSNCSPQKNLENRRVIFKEVE